MSEFVKVGEIRHPRTFRNTKARAGARASERGQYVLAPQEVEYIREPATSRPGRRSITTIARRARTPHLRRPTVTIVCRRGQPVSTEIAPNRPSTAVGARTEAVRHGRDSIVLEQLRQRRREFGFPLRMGNTSPLEPAPSGRAESELSAPATDDEPLYPASCTGRLDEHIQPVGNRDLLRQRLLPTSCKSL